MATYQPDINQMRTQYANVLADQQRKALRGVQDVYASRGITGGGEEAQAFGNLGQQFGLGAGQAEAGLQQYFGNLGMQQAGLGEQQRQFDVGQGNFLKQFGLAEQGQQFGQGLANRQFGLAEQGQQFGQGLANRQFGLAEQGQQFGQNINLANLYAQGLLGQNPFGAGSPFGSMQTQRSIDPEWMLASRLGLTSPAEMSLRAQIDPEGLRGLVLAQPTQSETSINSRPSEGGEIATRYGAAVKSGKLSREALSFLNDMYLKKDWARLEKHLNQIGV